MVSLLEKILGKKKKEVKEEPEQRPTSGSMAIKGETSSRTRLRSELGSLSMFSQVEENEGKITAMIIESTDKSRNPYLYIRFIFDSEGVDAYYSITPEVPNPFVRRLEVSKTVFTLLSLLENRKAFIPDKEDFYSKIVEAFALSTSFADADSLKMKYELDHYAKENSMFKAEVSKLKEEKEGLNHQLLELEKTCERLDSRVKHLEGLTNSELDREIVKWVEDHFGKLDEERFCSSFGISGTRLEERLDHLSKTGVVRIV